jgi:hypothetical protein
MQVKKFFHIAWLLLRYMINYEFTNRKGGKDE